MKHNFIIKCYNVKDGKNILLDKFTITNATFEEMEKLAPYYYNYYDSIEYAIQ